MAPSHTPHEWILRAVAPDSAPGLVLVIDEDEPVLRALRRILEADRHRVALAARSAEAARVLEDPALDVVLVDRMAQEASGLALLAEIKRARPDVKVIVMTAHVSVNDAVECMRRGAFDYLGKPFEDLRRVRDSVRRAVDRRRQSVSGGRRRAERDPARAGDGEPGWAAQGVGESAADSGELPLSLDAYEKSALERALRESAGDAGAAARRLGIGRSTFYRKLAKHGIGDGREAAVQARRHRGRVGPHSPIG
jgi:DNA-binding NtrC family response regulator